MPTKKKELQQQLFTWNEMKKNCYIEEIKNSKEELVKRIEVIEKEITIIDEEKSKLIEISKNQSDINLKERVKQSDIIKQELNDKILMLNEDFNKYKNNIIKKAKEEWIEIQEEDLLEKSDTEIEETINNKPGINKNYIIVSKWQLYSYLRKWYISSVPCGNEDVINENFIKNNILYLFNESNLPVVQGLIKEKTQYDIIVEIDLDNESKFLVKENWNNIGIRWFIPITRIKQIILKGKEECETFKNPVPNDNNNFVIPVELCSINEELYKKCTNEFNPKEWKEENIEEIVNKMEKYNRVLWAYFFSNFWIYANNIDEDYSSSFLTLMNWTYNDVYVSYLEWLDEPENKPLKIMRNLAYNGEFSKIQSTEWLLELLMNNHIINLSDNNYITQQYKSVSGFKNLEEFFNYKKDTTDNAVRQIITYLIKFCNNKSIESRSRELSQFVMQKFSSLKPNEATLFILWLCCWFNDIVCENTKPWKKELKDLSFTLKSRLLNDLYEFIITWNFKKDNNLIKKATDKPLLEQENQYVTKKEKYIIEWEEKWIVTERISYNEYYLIIIKKIYWNNYKKIKEGTYLNTFIERRVPQRKNYDNKDKIIEEMTKNITIKNEELEGVIKRDNDYLNKK